MFDETLFKLLQVFCPIPVSSSVSPQTHPHHDMGNLEVTSGFQLEEVTLLVI